MYTVSVKRDFIAQHYLIGGDWGAENEKHSHHYQVEIQLEGSELDRHGYLVDIVAIEQNLDALVAHFRDCTLNEMLEFSPVAPGVGPFNPSIEHFARILCSLLADRIQAPNISALTVKLWENEIAWASFRLEK
jgi:6-pyruvoyltetrahydropterin/6-carboxytetrahydropterin synthase